MKKILFLTWSYPNTLGSATILCTHRVMECVADSGLFEVHVLCCIHDKERKDDIIGNIHIHRIRPSVWVRMRNSFRKRSNWQKIDRICEVTQKFFTIPTFPQTYPVTERLFYNAAVKLQTRLGFSLVVSEHHGLVTLLSGCKLMEKFNVKHVAILWDPVKGEMATIKLPKPYTNHKINKVERFVADSTTLQISTKSMQSYHYERGDMAADHRVYLDIPSVLKPEEEVPSQYLNLLKRNYINIVYSGLLSEYYRDALPIVRLLNKCNDAERVNMIFFCRGEKVQLEKEAKKFKGSIVCHDYIPLAELHTLYRHADYLLNVSHINANMVPSKIFEYMSYGKPIISTYVTDGDSAEQYLSRYREGFCVDLKKSDTENVSLLNDFLKVKHNSVPFEEVKIEFKENTPEMFLEVIDRVINN